MNIYFHENFPAARLEASLLGGGEFLGDHMVFRENGGESVIADIL